MDDGTTSINTTSDLIHCAKFIPSDECKTDVDYSIANPTTFIGNWNESMDGDLWSGSLAINNPCPKGWTIPKSYKNLDRYKDDGDWSQISTSYFDKSSSKGGAMYIDNSGKAVSWYPASGRRLSENGEIEWFGDQSFFFWSQTINYAFSGIFTHVMGIPSYYYYDIRFGEYTQDDKGAKPAHGFSVRCVKE